MASLRNTLFIIEECKTAVPTLDHFVTTRADLALNIENSLQLFTYKPGTSQEARIYLEKKPTQPQDYLNLARIILNFKTSQDYDFAFSYPAFSARSGAISTLDELALCLLEDAAQAGHFKSFVLVKEIKQKQQAKNELMKKQSYQLVRNRNGWKKFEFWSKKPAPRSVLELEQIANHLATYKLESKDYILCHPEHLNGLITHLKDFADGLKTKARILIEAKKTQLLQLATTGKSDTHLKNEIKLLAQCNNVDIEETHKWFRKVDQMHNKNYASRPLQDITNVVYFRPRPAVQISPTVETQEEMNQKNLDFPSIASV